MNWLRSRFWMISVAGWLVAIALLASAAVTAIGANRLIDDALVEQLPVEVQRQLTSMMSQVEQAERKPGKKTDEGPGTAKILENNLFCPTCEPEVDEDETPEDAEPGGEGEVDMENLVESELPYTLAATMEADVPRFSIAVLVEQDSRTTRPLSPGDELQDGVSIERVERARVILRNKNRLEYIDVAGAAPRKKKSKSKARKNVKKETKRKKRKNSRAIEGAEEAVNCKGNTCTVDKRFRDKILANPALLAKQARVIPAIRDGETRGFKFYGIRSGSLPKLFGLKNGDMVTSINGTEMRSYDEVLGLYNRLRRSNHITVGIERNGKKMTKEVNFE